MVVGIDAREICQRPAGKGHYLARLIANWQQQSAFPIVFYIQEDQELPANFFKAKVWSSTWKVVKQKGRGPLWHRAVGRRLKADGVTVFFAALTYQSAIWNKVPTVTIVHDLAIFKLPHISHNKKAQLVERLTLAATVERSKKIIVVSENTKKDLLEATRINPLKVEVVFAASLLTEKYHPKEEEPLLLEQRGKYLLFVGTLEPRKNITTLLKAYSLLPKATQEEFHLKLVGKPGWGGEDYPALAKELGIEQTVEFLGYVDDSDMYDLYRKATALVYPSWYEGFGMPLIEAMSVGTPVVSSNRSSLPEVLGNTGILCSPDDPQEFAEATQTLLSDPKLYNRYSQEAYKRSKLFSWADSSQKIQNILEKASL